MTLAATASLLQAVRSLRIGVIGDFALDVYYEVNRETGEISLETGKPVFHGSGVHAHPGGAGNVAHNLVALGVGEVQVFGLIGDDQFGRELTYLLRQQGVQVSALLPAMDAWDTCVYIKPHIGKSEDSRLDFGSSNRASAADLNRVLSQLENQLPHLDVLLVNQQFLHPLLTPHALNALDELLKSYPQVKVFSDLRNPETWLTRGALKSNVREIAHLLGESLIEERDDILCLQYASEANRLTGLPILLTRGENGLMYVHGENQVSMPGIYLSGEIDSVGAGDTCISAFAACLGAGGADELALEIANLASAVTTGKLYQTGTATPKEILALAENCAYTYHLDLAHDLRKAQYWKKSDIEIVEEWDSGTSIRYAVIDHDGTLSTLREGWDSVMHQFMVESIAGPAWDTLPETDLLRLTEACTQLINDTTGMPTIVQMEGLRERVLLEGYQHGEAVCSAEDHKARFLDRLMDQVNDRLMRFKAGERTLDDFTLKGTWDMLNKLLARGIILYLASGTDEEHVRREAEVLGYARLFEGGIHGAKAEDSIGAKRRVLMYLLNQKRVKGEEIMVLGDGPAEIMEGRKVGALCIGVASDEVRRHGWNPVKRTRLIRSGAHLVIPDYSQAGQLLEYIFPSS